MSLPPAVQWRHDRFLFFSYIYADDVMVMPELFLCIKVVDGGYLIDKLLRERTYGV